MKIKAGKIYRIENVLITATENELVWEDGVSCGLASLETTHTDIAEPNECVVRLGSPEPAASRADYFFTDKQRRAEPLEGFKIVKQWTDDGQYTGFPVPKENINFSITQSDGYFRFPCHVCGGHTEKQAMTCKVTEGEHEGLTVCWQCMQERDFDERLTKHAERDELRARYARSLIGRLAVPPYEEFLRAEQKFDDEFRAEQGLPSRGLPGSFENPIAGDLDDSDPPFQSPI